MKKLLFILLGTLTLQFSQAQAPFTTPDNIGSGNCLDFDGVSNNVSIPNSASLNFGTGDFSYELWIRMDESASYSQPHQFLSKKTGGDYEVQINANRKISAYFGYPITFAESTTLVQNGVWYHIAVVRTSNVGYLYINGELESSVVASQNVSGSADVLLGRDVSAGEFFYGKLDDVRIWNRTLTQAEIRDNMCNSLQGNESGLVGYWSMNEGTGNTVNDLTSNNNHGIRQ